MNTTMKRVLCAALAVLLLAGLCGCTKDERPKSDPVYREDVTDYCLITEELDQTYKLRVINPYQQTVYERKNLSVPPRLEALDNGEVAIFYDHNGNVDLSWALVCNPESGFVSDIIGDACYMRGGYAVYRDYLTGQHHLFVRDLRQDGAYLEATTLEGIDVTNPFYTIKEGKDGKVTATYETMEGEKKTVDVKLPE